MVRFCICGSCYLFWMFGGAGAAAAWVARFECACRGFVKAADHWLAAAQRGWTHLRVHWCNVMRKVLHGVKGPSGQVVSHGKVHGTAEVNKVSTTVINQSQRFRKLQLKNLNKVQTMEDLKKNINSKMRCDNCDTLLLLAPLIYK